tara:strand:+ start:174 stop:455 length:282 start_codon:yes stop_codon:yes gene_type:complete
MIKKYKFILFIFFLTTSNTNAFNEKNERQMYIGCYQNSKLYLGAEKAKTYCLCTVKKLSEKFSDEQLEIIFSQKPEKIIEDTSFASKFCEKEI